MGPKANHQAKSSQLDLFDAAEAKKRRDWGREKVIQRQNEEWRDAVISMIARLPAGWIGLAEDIREAVNDATPMRPSHSNAWGSIITKAARMGLLVETGVWRTSRSVRSHGSRYPEYRRP
jgi:hypothetical protein